MKKITKTNENTIGQRLALLRKEKGFTQKELAKKICISHYSVSDYETGRLHLNDKMIACFAIALEVSADEILGLKKIKTINKNPSLRIMKRLIKIEKLPLSQQKAVLKILDMALQNTN